MRPAYLFIRDDDVKAAGGYFKEFFRLFLEKDLPVVYAVIPDGLDSRLAGMLKRQKARTPGLLDIVQHGWSHADHSRPGERKYEFGPSRCAACQGRDLKRGMSVMKSVFGKMFTSVFVPPFHGYDATTLGLVKKCRFAGFSAGKKAFSPGDKVLDIPAGISFGARNGQGKKMDHRYMLRHLVRAVVPGQLTGILLHHEEFAAQGLEGELQFFLKGISRWRDKGGIKIILLSDVLGRRSSFQAGS